MTASNRILIGAAIAISSFAGLAVADEDAPSISRTEVAAEVARASAIGALVPAGERTPFFSNDSAISALPRIDVKRATRMAMHNGVMLPAGETAPYSVPGGASTMTRAERKADVLRAGAAGELLPAGEGTYAVAKPAAARKTAAAESEVRPQLAAR